MLTRHSVQKKITSASYLRLISFWQQRDRSQYSKVDSFDEYSLCTFHFNESDENFEVYYKSHYRVDNIAYNSNSNLLTQLIGCFGAKSNTSAFAWKLDGIIVAQIKAKNKEKHKKIINKKKKRGIISYRSDYEYKEKKQKWLNVKISVSPKAIDNLDMNTLP